MNSSDPQSTRDLVGHFMMLHVVSMQRIGAFLDSGFDKDILLPFAEQTRSVQMGQDVLVAIYLDNNDRPCASMRLEKFLDDTPGSYKEGEAVELLIFGRTDLGYKAIINSRHSGILYENEVFRKLQHGDQVQGYIRKIRPDGKIDLGLSKTGHKAGEDLGPQILEMLAEQNGFLDITDKTAPEKIYELFGVSKKKYKIAIGILYKSRQITVHDDGIRLVAKKA